MTSVCIFFPFARHEGDRYSIIFICAGRNAQMPKIVFLLPQHYFQADIALIRNTDAQFKLKQVIEKAFRVFHNLRMQKCAKEYSEVSDRRGDGTLSNF